MENSDKTLFELGWHEIKKIRNPNFNCMVI